MILNEIQSKSNDKIKRVHALINSASDRKKTGLFVLEGLRLCRDAALNGVRSNEVFITKSAYLKHKEYADLIIDMSDKAYFVSNDVFSKISNTENSQGIVAVYSTSVLPQETRLSNEGRYIACENLADPSNLGAIARTSEALGATGMILLGSCCDRLNPKALRASMGALIRLPIIVYGNAVHGIETVRSSGIKSYASVVTNDAKAVTDVSFTDGSMIVIGNEANGMTAESVSACDERITIPIRGKAESFNAAAAAAILLWELTKL